MRISSLFKYLFFLTIILQTINAKSQQPGGDNSPGVKVWLIPAANGVKWINKNTNNTTSLSQLPVGDTQNVNFNTTLRFRRGVPYPILISGVRPVTIVTAFYPNFNNGQKPRPDSFYTVKFNGKLLQKYKYNSLINDHNDTVSSRFPFIIENEVKWRTAMKISASYFPSFPALNNSRPEGNDMETKLTLSMDGYSAELLIYDVPLSPADLWKVQTYFAIKYGITLDTSYASSSAEIIWNKELRSPFHNRVCAIGKDIRAAILQPFSNTTYEDGVDNISFNNPSNGPNRSVTIGFEKAAFIAIPDKQFLFWGDDKGKTDETIFEKITGANPPGQIELVKRKWIMQNDMNIVQPTRVELGGDMLDKLENVNHCYLFIKLRSNLDSTDIFPLDNKFNSKQFRTGISWSNGVDTFTFGRAPLLKIENLILCKRDSCNRRNELILAKRVLLGTGLPDPLSKCRFVIGYIYRTYKSEKTVCKTLETLPPKTIEVYFSGGIAPYQYRLKDSDVPKTFSFETNQEGIIIGRISDLPAGAQEITITDMTRQKLKIKVVVQ